MNDIFTCTIDCKARSKQRPRFNGKHAYMDKRYMQSKDEVAWMVKEHRPPLIPEGDVHFYVLIEVKGKGRSDDDNLLGWLCDALEGTCYTNDRQVRLHAYDEDRGPVHRNTGHDRITIMYASNGRKLV